MKAVEIGENQKEVWNKFIAENNSESFLQSWEWGEFQRALGRRIWKLAITEDGLFGDKEMENPKSQTCPREASGIPNPKQIPNLSPRGIGDPKSQTISNFQFPISKEYPIPDHCRGQASNIQYPSNILAIALIIKHDLPFGRSYLYCPRGPVINKFKVQSSKFKVLDLLSNEIRKVAKKEKAVFLRIDPPVNQNLESGIWNLKESGFVKFSAEIQPKNTLVLDLTKSEEELLKEMKPKTRYNIRLAIKKGVGIINPKSQTCPREASGIPNPKQIPNLSPRGIGDPKFQADSISQYNAKPNSKYFEKFWELMEETSKRDGFRSHSKDYYWKMLKSIGVEDALVGNYHSKSECDEVGKYSDCERQILKQVQNDKSRNYVLENLKAGLYFAEYNNKIIAANIVLYFGDLAIYLHGASSSEYRSVMAPYLLQWRQILDARKSGYALYDFWGIGESSKFKIDSKFQKWSGITRFKKGFGGYEKKYAGAYDLVFDEFGYSLYNFGKRLKRFY